MAAPTPDYTKSIPTAPTSPLSGDPEDAITFKTDVSAHVVSLVPDIQEWAYYTSTEYEGSNEITFVVIEFSSTTGEETGRKFTIKLTWA